MRRDPSARRGDERGSTMLEWALYAAAAVVAAAIVAAVVFRVIDRHQDGGSLAPEESRSSVAPVPVPAPAGVSP